jgi:hypothetical protein
LCPVDDSELEPGGVVFHPGVLDQGVGPGQLCAEVLLGPTLLLYTFNLNQSVTQRRKGLGHLFSLAPGGKFGLFQQSNATG